MNVLGPNNLGFPLPIAKSAGNGKASGSMAQDNSAAFEGILGEAQNQKRAGEERAQSQSQNQSQQQQPPRQEPRTQSQSQTLTQAHINKPMQPRARVLTTNQLRNSTPKTAPHERPISSPVARREEPVRQPERESEYNRVREPEVERNTEREPEAVASDEVNQDQFEQDRFEQDRMEQGSSEPRIAPRQDSPMSEKMAAKARTNGLQEQKVSAQDASEEKVGPREFALQNKGVGKGLNSSGHAGVAGIAGMALKTPYARALASVQNLPADQDLAAIQIANIQPAVNQESVQEFDPEMEALTSLGEESIPGAGGGGLPNFSGPSLTERVVTPQVGTQVLPALGKASASPKQDEVVNSLTRRVVWNDFLRKMNNLGVTAEDVVHAFSTLSPEQLKQSPEKSVDSVVMALGLNDQQALLARQYFNELIQKTQSKTLGEELAVSDKQIGLTLMSQREIEHKNMERSLAGMNTRFFMNANGMHKATGTAGLAKDKNGGKAAAAAATPQETLQAGMDRLATPTDLGDDSDFSQATPLNVAGLPSPIPAPASALAAPETTKMVMANSLKTATPAPVAETSVGASVDAATAELNSLLEKMKASSSGSSNEDGKSSKELGKVGPTHTGLNAAAAFTPQMNVAQAVAVEPTTHAAPNALLENLGAAIPGLGKNQIQHLGDADQSSGADASAIGASVVTDARMNSTPQQVKGEFQAQMAHQTAGTQPMAVPELVQQAQMMVRDGGGEMKVTLHPEGMGEVAMRVSVEQGKVNVQMITESDEAKHLLERSIGDLKSGLAQNHLQVDTIKIDTASNLGRQLEQQYQDAQRQQAQQNLAQFRQDNQGWRRSFFDTPNVRQYPSQNEAPRDVHGSGASASSAKKSGSRRLDLVA